MFFPDIIPTMAAWDSFYIRLLLFTSGEELWRYICPCNQATLYCSVFPQFSGQVPVRKAHHTRTSVKYKVSANSHVYFCHGDILPEVVTGALPAHEHLHTYCTCRDLHLFHGKRRVYNGGCNYARGQYLS